MSKLKGLLLTEGMHGMISQVEGLAKSLDLEFIHEKIELNNIWGFFPPKITPIKKFVFKNDLENEFNIVISCGRKSVIPSIYLKKKYKKKIINIHIQDPKVSAENFDFIIAPEHDNLSGSNILKTKGAVHYLTNEELITNENYLKPKINLNKKIVSFIIGGPNKYYKYDNNSVNKIFSQVKENFIQNDYQVIIIPSIRTPKKIIEMAKNYFKDQIVILEVDKKAYLSSLQLANHIVVTCDSTSMISEAALTGKPIYIAQMPPIKNNKRFQDFYRLFEKLNITKNLNLRIENWTYEKLDETKRVSLYIKDKINKHDFS
tara:strand:- start:2282 stop:3232 length:951 start_codon:yes stop_codon:yes gene_type:complete